MSKIFNYYCNDKDKTWYTSSNIKYSECDDKEGELKVLRVVFNNGAQYEYTGVDVNQYLLFREDSSQGKALNKYIKGNNYEYKKLDNVNVQELDDEVMFRLSNGVFIVKSDNGFKLLDNKDNVLMERNEKIDDDTLDIIIEIAKSLGRNVKVKEE